MNEKELLEQILNTLNNHTIRFDSIDIHLHKLDEKQEEFQEFRHETEESINTIYGALAEQEAKIESIDDNVNFLVWRTSENKKGVSMLNGSSDNFV